MDRIDNKLAASWTFRENAIRVLDTRVDGMRCVDSKLAANISCWVQLFREKTKEVVAMEATTDDRMGGQRDEAQKVRITFFRRMNGTRMPRDVAYADHSQFGVQINGSASGFDDPPMQMEVLDARVCPWLRALRLRARPGSCRERSAVTASPQHIVWRSR